MFRQHVHGRYLQNRFSELASLVNSILEGKETSDNKDIVSDSKTNLKGNIAIIQSELNKKYGYNIAVDNKYGYITNHTLIKALQHELNVQCKANLKEDGIFGNLTKAKCVSVKQGHKGNITWLIQAMLVCKGYNVAIDGIFGAKTAEAVRLFQKKNGLSQDGIVGKNTFEKLFK